MNKTIYRSCLSVALAFCCAAVPGGSASAAGEYQRLIDGLTAASADNGITRVAVGAFSASGGSVEDEASFAAEKTLSGLAADRRLQVLDQAALEAQPGGKEGWLRRLPAKLRPQAFVRGSVFRDGETVRVLARLVDSVSGRVIVSMEASSRARNMELPPVPDMDWNTAPAMTPARDLFRDAPADGEFDCSAAFRGMDRVNDKAFDLKARYWAAKMKEPGFLTGSLTRNPGSEIRDPQVKQKFYELLSRYHDEENPPVLSEAQVKKLEEFMGKESGVIDNCGIK